MVWDILIFVVVLGELIFFHELGHFLAAKACGIYCDRFSLGMPPRLIGFRWGETDYCLGALPIGGYVKMAGQEDVPASEEERQQEYAHVPPNRWFNHKPVWQRGLVILAGPLMNLLLALGLYGTGAVWGDEVPETKVDNRIGMVEEGSPATTAPLYALAPGANTADLARPPDAIGWQTGDRIVSIDGQPITSIADVAIDAFLGAGKVLKIVIERTDNNGAVTRYLSPVEPQRLAGEEHPRFGVAPFYTALVKKVEDDMPAKEHGIQPGDIIIRANGKTVDRETFAALVRDMTHGETLDLEVQRGKDTLAVSLRPKVVGRIMGATFGPAEGAAPDQPDAAAPVVLHTSDELRAETDLTRLDILQEINGQPATLALLKELELASPGETLTVSILRPAIWRGLLRREEVKQLQLPVTPVGMVGVTWDVKRVYYSVPWRCAFPAAVRESYRALDRTLRTLRMLVTGAVRPKDLGGPLMISQAIIEASRLGRSWLLEMTAFISINLFVFNLLPLPVLDGGMLLFLAIEGIRRKPLDIRLAERIQQAGLAFIILLMLFVTYNDVWRLIGGIVP